MILPLDPFGRSSLPADFSREDRVRLIGEVGAALVEGVPPSRRAALFVGAAIAAWLSEGGDLEGDFLRVKSVRGSHRTAAALWRTLRDEPGETGPHRDERQPEPMSLASLSSESERTS